MFSLLSSKPWCKKKTVLRSLHHPFSLHCSVPYFPLPHYSLHQQHSLRSHRLKNTLIFSSTHFAISNNFFLEEKSVFDLWGWFQMASFTVPCPKCVSFAHLGLNSQTQQQNMHTVSFQSGFGLKKSHSFGTLIRDPASSGSQVRDCIKWESGFEIFDSEYHVNLFRFWIVIMPLYN